MENITKALIAIITIGCLFCYTYHLGNVNGISATESKYLMAVKREQQKALTDSLVLEKKHSTLLIEKENEFKKIITDRDNLIVELRKRPKRTEETTRPPTSTSTCTGRELYAEDAEFLAREAARADKIIAERNYYYEMYKQVKEILNGN